jgi:hypothetical protein
MDVCPSCQTDLRPLVSGWIESRQQFQVYQGQIAAGNGSFEAVEFLTMYLSFLSALLRRPSAELVFVEEVLKLGFELGGNVNVVDADCLKGVDVSDNERS